MQLLVHVGSVALLTVVALSATAVVPPAVPTAVATAGARQARADPALPESALVSVEEPAGPASRSGATVFTDGGTSAPGSIQVRAGVSFSWPLSPGPALRRPFEQPHSEWSRGHRGADLLAAVGQPVLSAGEGVVAFSGEIAGRGVITVRHAGVPRTTYEPVEERLASGTIVHRGTPIGVVSATPGHCVPLTCIHWGAIWGQTYRDPLSLLGFGRPILLPLG